MTTTKHIATADGQTFTRTSKSRVYTHVVLAKASLDHQLAMVASKFTIDLHRSNHAFHVGNLNPDCKLRPTWQSEASLAAEGQRYAQRAAEELEGTSTVEEYVAKKQAQSFARIEEDRLDGQYERWGVVGWCGRRDLADKLAATTLGRGYYGDVVVVEAQIVSE